MKTSFCTWALLFTGAAGCACAEALAPELAPLAAKYKSDLEALESQRAAALAQAQRPYTVALDAAERTAAAANDVAMVALIARERAAIGSGLMSPGFPAGLPKELRNPRKSYLETLARTQTIEAQRRQAIDGFYLRGLTSLQARAAKDSELAKQVAAERKNLLAKALQSATAGTGADGRDKPNAKSAVINGTFELADAEGLPSGWTINDAFTVARDGANHVVRATAQSIGYREISQEIALPPKAKSVALSGRVRGKWENRDPQQSHWGAHIAIVFVGANEQRTTDWIMLDGGTDAGWKSLSGTGTIPKGSQALQVVLVLKYVTGTFDFDDIAVEFD